VFLLLRQSGVLLPAGGGDVRCSIQALRGMEQVSAPSVNEANSSQQGPGLSEGIQATPSLLTAISTGSYNLLILLPVTD
jgi:hypothetical protein